MKKFLFISASTLSALALAGMVSAYTSANVTNLGSGAITTTQTSLLALSAGTGPLGNTGVVTFPNGQLKIDLTEGTAGSSGVQANSEYEWDNVLKVRNNSASTVKFDLGNPTMPAGLTIAVYDSANTSNNNALTGIVLAPNTEVDLTIKVTTGANPPGLGAVTNQPWVIHSVAQP